MSIKRTVTLLSYAERKKWHSRQHNLRPKQFLHVEMALFGTNSWSFRGGTNPSLLEAMGAGNLVNAHDNLGNREVSGDTALYSREPTDLASRLREIERDTKGFSGLRRAAQNRAFKNYEWGKVADSYNNLFLETLD